MTAEQARTEILDVATRLFAARGYEATSLTDIATEWGGSKATVLYHFHTKAAILHELVRPAAAALTSLLDRSAGAPPVRARREVALGFVDLAIGYREALASYPAAIRTIVEIPELADLGLVEAGDRLVAVLGGAAGDTLSSATATLFLNGVLAAAQTLAHLPADELAAALATLAGRLLELGDDPPAATG